MKGGVETKRLNRESFKRIAGIFEDNARSIERAIFEDRFVGRCEEKILDELRWYQNGDGGFGKGIEPDFLLPLSSPLATSVGFRYILNLKNVDPSPVAEHAIGYLEKTFVSERKGWYAVPEDVNDFPHAPWWHCDEETGITVIDRSWGNPSAEIIGYLCRYRKFLKKLDPDELVEIAAEHLGSIDKFVSEHEVYCYVRLFESLPEDLSERFRDKLTEAVTSIVRPNRKDWDEYVPKPLDFVQKRDSFRFGMTDDQMDVQLDYLVETLELNGFIEPVWSWGAYPDEWTRSKKVWTGILTLRALISLDEFGRVER